MSTIREANIFNGRVSLMVESFNSAQEVADVSETRTITDSSFMDMHIDKNIGSGVSGAGVETWSEAMGLLRTGYQPTIDRMKSGIKKVNVHGQSKRTSFKNDIVGYQPIVPLAIQGVPNCMVNSYMKPMKSKVLNIYYDMSASWKIESKDLIAAGQDVLAAIMELEMQGYKFNLYAMQTFYDRYSIPKKCYALCTKIKSANTPMDLRRISFPLTHTAYFRVIGFDWLSRCPKAGYISGYGCDICAEHPYNDTAKEIEKFMGEKCIYFSANEIIKSRNGKDTIKEALSGGKN